MYPRNCQAPCYKKRNGPREGWMDTHGLWLEPPDALTQWLWFWKDTKELRRAAGLGPRK